MIKDYNFNMNDELKHLTKTMNNTQRALFEEYYEDCFDKFEYFFDKMHECKKAEEKLPQLNEQGNSILNSDNNKMIELSRCYEALSHSFEKICRNIDDKKYWRIRQGIIKKYNN